MTKLGGVLLLAPGLRHAANPADNDNARSTADTRIVCRSNNPAEDDTSDSRTGSRTRPGTGHASPTQCEFDSTMVPRGTRRLGECDDMILSLFAKGMTTRDIAEHLRVTYDAKISHETISNITDAINDTVKQVPVL